MVWLGLDREILSRWRHVYELEAPGSLHWKHRRLTHTITSTTRMFSPSMTGPVWLQAYKRHWLSRDRLGKPKADGQGCARDHLYLVNMAHHLACRTTIQYSNMLRERDNVVFVLLCNGV